jgi:hypothetical protein
MPHPDEGLIHAWLDGELDEAEAARVADLVAHDAEWSAAAAEARGLIAASSRITGALDRVPGRVVPLRKSAARSIGWRMRAAALLLVVAGATVVLRRTSPDEAMRRVTTAAPAGSSIAPVVQSSPPAPVVESRPVGIAAAKTPARSRSEQKEQRAAEPAPPVTASADFGKRADQPKPVDALRDKLAADLDSKARNTTGASVAEKDQSARLQSLVKAPALPFAPAASGAVAQARLAKAAESGAVERCFEVRQPADSTKRVIRLTVAALADSIQSHVLQLQGDTLTDASRRFVALLVHCPER